MEITKNSLDEFFGATNLKIDYEKQLNKEQYEAVINTEGPELIIAGAGSGKTRTLTYRLAYLIEQGVSPDKILLLTFTNKAAIEMIERATSMLGSNYKIKGGTYHSFCAKLLRKYGKRIGINTDFIIKNGTEAVDAMNYVKELNGYSKEKDFPKGNELIAIYSICINKDRDIEWVLTNKYPRYTDYLEDILKLQDLYTSFKRERNILDYDDLLILTNQLLRENDDIRKTVSDLYQYIMVDEYQDSNKLQFEFISLLRSFENKNICVVGDDQQCLVEGSLIHTKRGPVKIEKLKKSDEILVSAGNGTYTYAHPSEIMKKNFIGSVYEITTKGGKTITVTGDHTLFVYRKKFKPRTADTADLYMFGEQDSDGSYIHKLFISDKRLVNELNSKNIYDAEKGIDAFQKLLKKKQYSRLTMEKYAKITEECTHYFIEAQNVQKGMFIPVYNEKMGKVINDQITSVTEKAYGGYVYDINVHFYMNYFAGDICVHNCIYGFRGSNHKNILNFPKQFEGCKTVILNRNYRSNQEILDFTNAVSAESKEKFEKELLGTHHAEHKPEIVYVGDEKVEAEAIVYDIIKRHREGTPYKDMAVLIRASNDSNMVEAYLNMTNLPGGPIPFKKFGGLKFMERAFVMDILAFLKVLVNERDELPWFRIFQMYLNIGPAYAKKLVAEINRDGVEALNNPEHQKRKYGECLPMIYEFYNACKAKDFSQQMDDIINIHYYNARKLTIDNKKTQESVRREDRKELDKNIEEAQVLIEMARPYKTASDFLNDIALDANANNAEDDDYLTISTIHSAKGLEFDTVYIMNCVDGKFPMIKQPAADTIEAIEEAEEEFEEERRVFYVAATRAKENLKMYVPEIVYKFGRTEQATMNSFLKNNKEYCELIRVR